MAAKLLTEEVYAGERERQVKGWLGERNAVEEISPIYSY